MARRKELKSAVEKILKLKGVNYNDWKNDVINHKKLEVMSDKDKEWTEKTVEDASLDLIMEDITDAKEDKNSAFVTNESRSI